MNGARDFQSRIPFDVLFGFYMRVKNNGAAGVRLWPNPDGWLIERGEKQKKKKEKKKHIVFDDGAVVYSKRLL